MSDPTIEDVARLAGVSVATVSRALRDLPNVAAGTRERVVEAARTLDYETHPSAARLATGRTLTVGVIAPHFGTWYANLVVAGAERVLASAGYDLLLAAIAHRDHLDAFLQRARSFGRRVDATLLVDLYLPDDAARHLRAFSGPVLSVGALAEDLPSLNIDHVGAATRATRHLAELGHRRIGLLRATTEHGFLSPVPELRLQGYAAALDEVGIAVDDTLIADGGWTVAGGADGIEQLLGHPDPPTAVFCMSDPMAIGARRKAQELGCRVPEDLSIVGFDDHELSAAFGITTMRQDVEAFGRRGAELLLESLADDEPPRNEVGEVELVIRHSTAPPASAR